MIFRVKIIFCIYLIALAGCQSQTSPEPKKENPAPSQQSASSSEIPKPEDISFESFDKVKIIGSFYQSPKENSPAVLLLHQPYADKEVFDSFARGLQEKGIGSLAIDMRKGRKPPVISLKIIDHDYQKEYDNWLADAAEAFEFLKLQKNVDPKRLGIIGASFGSEFAVLHAARDQSVKALILLSPSIAKVGEVTREIMAVATYRERPMLIVAAEDDEQSLESARKIRRLQVNRKCEMQIYSSGGHGTMLLNSNPASKELLEDFLMRSL